MSELGADLNTACNLLNYERLGADAERLQAAYVDGDPFPHLVIDDFLDADVFAALVEQLPSPDQPMLRFPKTAILKDGRQAQYLKLNYAEGEVQPLVQLLFWQLNSARFLSVLEELTGIADLISDPRLHGSGIHVVKPGGLLRVHADFNRHPVYDLDRRINFLLYLTPDWRDEWGGHLELWNSDVSECRQRIAPRGNRCVIFNTSSTSFHGHPHALTCPEHVQRRSLAMYYYTNGRPVDETQEKHATLWPDMPYE